MAKILFINPVVRMEDVPKHVPYGIALLAAICDKAGHEVQVFDANAWRPGTEAIRQVLRADDWDVVGIGGITTTYGYVKMLVGELLSLPRRPLIVVGGGLMTSMPHDIMRLIPGIDLGVVGEAFVTLPEILSRVDAGSRDWATVDGVIWRGPDGKSRLNRPRSLLRNLDELPYPAWDFFPLEIYFKNSMDLASEEAMVAQRRLDINGSFGCSLICRFCFHLGLTGELAIFETKGDRDVTFTYERDIRYHSADYIVNMVCYLKEKYGVDFIAFLDENLMTMNVATGGKWLKEICEKWIEAGLQPSCVREGVSHDPRACQGVHWGGTSHAGLVNEDILGLMKRSGCSYLIYGLESFNARVLKNIGKGSTPQANERAVHITMQAGIRPIPNQIIGFPDEAFDSIYDAMDAWDRLGIVVKPFFATPYPGSEWYYTYKNRILEQYDGDLEAFLLDLGDASNITAVISENFDAVELLGLRELMMGGDRRQIQQYERRWRRLNGEPHLPKFVAAGWKERVAELRAGRRDSLYVEPA